jgi:hypothetical protein
LPRLASNCDPPDLCLLSNKDYKCEPPAPGFLEPEFIVGEEGSHKMNLMILQWEKIN